MTTEDVLSRLRPNIRLPTQTIGFGPFLGKPMNAVRLATILANRKERP